QPSADALNPFTEGGFHEAVEPAKATVRHGRLGELSRKLTALLTEVGGAGGGGGGGGGTTAAPPGGYLQRLAIKGGGRVALLPVRDIDWVEAEKDYVRLHVGKQAPRIRKRKRILQGQP